MALVDVTTQNWSESGVTETFTYADSRTIEVTYTGAESTGSDLPDTAAQFYRDSSNNPVDTVATVSFSEPASGVVLQLADFDANLEAAAVYVDGQKIDLEYHLLAGHISFSGDGVVGDGSNVIDSNGHFDPTPGNDNTLSGGPGNASLTYIHFNIPVNTLGVQSIYDNASGGAMRIGMDVFIDDEALPPCFTAGTLVETDQGPVPVETLQAGDRVRTKDHGFQPVKWVGGSRVVDAAVRIAAGTFGNTRDLVVSPRHRMLLQGWQVDLMFNHEEVFATAGHLKNGTTITQEPEGWVEYFHVLLDRHEVIYAEGAETESFFPDEASLNSMAKATREELAQIVDLSTFGRTVRPTLTANQAMYLSHNMDLLEDEQPQAHAAE